MISLEHLTDNSITARNFLALARLVPDTGGVTLSQRQSDDTATWTAAVRSASSTIDHGLGTTPAAVLVTSHDTDISYAVTARTSTTITVTGRYLVGTALTGTFGFDWLAIG